LGDATFLWPTGENITTSQTIKNNKIRGGIHDKKANKPAPKAQINAKGKKVSHQKWMEPKSSGGIISSRGTEGGA